MIQTYEAIISENGDVELLEPDKLARARRALVTVLEDLPVSNQQRSPKMVEYSIPVGKDQYHLGKLSLPDSPAAYLPEQRQLHRIMSLNLDEPSVAHLDRLPALHRDPFDRMLICQALE